jgi:hypothetical protein
VFYTPGEPLTVSQGDRINGQLTCAPNKRNNRDLDISISYGVNDDERTTFEYKMCVFIPLPLLISLKAELTQVIIVVLLSFLHLSFFEKTAGTKLHSLAWDVVL